MFAQAIEDILKDECTPAVVRAIEAGGSPAALWRAVEGAGFLELLAPEDAGGAALALPDMYEVLATLGRYAVPVPIAQSMVVRALLGAGQAAPPGMITLAASCSRDGAGRIRCPLTPCAMVADTVLAADADGLLLLPVADAQREVVGVHGSLLASLVWPAGSGRRVDGDPQALEAFAASLHAAMMAGAMTRVFGLTLQYCNDRQQFGKSLGKFQAVQHQLSVMAEEVVAACVAAEAAFDTHAATPSMLAAAVAKSRTSEAAARVAATSHALHGAIGITQEYDLQLWTRRLHEWRMAHGSEAYWNLVVGRQVLADERTLVDFVRTF